MNNFLSILNLKIIWIGILCAFVLLFFYIKRQLQTKYLINLLSHIKNRSLLFSGYFKNFRRLSLAMFILGIFAFFLTFCRIGWGDETIKIKQSGRAILFALDISRSMLASDITPSRLEMAKIKIRNISLALGAEKVGLMLFSISAILICTFTIDTKAFNSFLNQIDQSVVSSSANTSLMDAFLKALDIFKIAKNNSKILIILTDGEDFSQNSSNVLDKAKEEGLALFALGVGPIKGAPVPIINAIGEVIGHEKNSDGSVILTKLEEEKLSEVVSYLGGKYQRMTYSENDIKSIISFVESFEKEHFADTSFEVRNETYPFFAFLTGLFLMLEALFC
jgi:Ca-activated chloride channel family protein